MTKNKLERIWCIVPAAGVSVRMQTVRPKQYLTLGSSTVLDVTLRRLLSSKYIDKVVVCIHSEDKFWHESFYANNTKVTVITGGSQRACSVANGLKAISKETNAGDWVVVHDAARPCVKNSDINLLIETALELQQGAILATRVVDTIKEVTNGVSSKTIERSLLWRALTPQIFKVTDLKRALQTAKEKKLVITDEASAIEQINKPVRIVEGSADNIKITSADDLKLASFFIDQQGIQ